MKDKIKDILRPVYRSFLAYKNRGKNVKCNICGKRFRSLRPVVGRHADGTKYIIEDHVGSCWFCNSYPRMRQMWFWLSNDYKIQGKNGLRILHVAPEVSISKILKRYRDVEYICIDKHCPGYRYPAYVKEGDILSTDFPDNHFDVVICNHVLEHIKDDSTAIKEIFRITKKNGLAILMVPLDYDLEKTDEEGEQDLSPAEREQRFGQYDHVRLYGKDYFQRLESVGFDVERVTCEDKIVDSYGFQPGEELIICHK